MKHQKKLLWISLTAVLVLTLAAVQAARAGKFHFNSIELTLGNSLVLNGILVGLGNEAAHVTMTGYGSVIALCENPGGNQAPGRNPVSVAVQEAGIFVTGDNGRSLVEVVAPDPTEPEFAPSPTPKQAGCPNGNWSVVGMIDGSTDWTGASVVVRDEAGEVRIELTFSCTTVFEDGIAVEVVCTES
jgi:hypothetical protein